MHRPEVSVVMPFAGDRAAGRMALETLLALDTGAGDELILADNSGLDPAAPGVTVVGAPLERSPAHARNAGARHAHNDWILFLDADCRAPSGLLEAYFAQPIAHDVGVLAGEVLSMPGGQTLVERYGAARGFLSQRAHLEHPFKPRAVAANLMVRRAAFEQVGGFFEGVRAAEDTDFSWRMQDAGWRLELRPGAWVEHRYRTTLAELRRQWRGYAAGRAWLARRYQGFEPQSGLHRAVGRARRRVWAGTGSPALRAATGPSTRSAHPSGSSPVEHAGYLALDALLALEELAGLSLSNRPERPHRAGTHVVLVADHFPVRDDPLLELARALDGARIEAVARPGSPALQAGRELPIDYREDDGSAVRWAAAAMLLTLHPLRCARDRLRRRPGEPTLTELAPAVSRLRHDRLARVLPLGGEATRATALRLATLAGRPIFEAPSPSLRGRAGARRSTRR